MNEIEELKQLLRDLKPEIEARMVGFGNAAIYIDGKSYLPAYAQNAVDHDVKLLQRINKALGDEWRLPPHPEK